MVDLVGFLRPSPLAVAALNCSSEMCPAAYIAASTWFRRAFAAAGWSLGLYSVGDCGSPAISAAWPRLRLEQCVLKKAAAAASQPYVTGP